MSGRWAAPHGSSSWPTACSPTSSWRRRSSRWRARTRASIPTTSSSSSTASRPRSSHGRPASRGPSHADTVRPARPAQGRRPGAGALRRVGDPDPADPVVARTDRCGRCRDARPRHQRGRSALPAGSDAGSFDGGPVGRPLQRERHDGVDAGSILDPAPRSGCGPARLPTNGPSSASSRSGPS